MSGECDICGVMGCVESNHKEPNVSVPVLDKGFVKYIQHMGSDLTVVNAARVSFAKQSKQFTQQDAKLVAYLKKNNHWTPFGHCALTVHMKMPIFVARQWMRSNVGIVYNEVSRRYVDDVPEFYTPQTWRSRPDGSIKQGSGSTTVERLDPTQFFIGCERQEDAPEDLWGGFDNNYHPTLHVGAGNQGQLDLYRWMLKSGVAPEMARTVLPQSTYTELWMTASLPACLRLIQLRDDSHAQWEIQEYGRALKKIVSKLWSVSSQ